MSKLAQLPDAPLEQILPQLVQCLKLPSSHARTTTDSDGTCDLMRFLLERALLNPTYVGCSLFWVLRSEMSKGGRTAARHGALLAAYLGAVGSSMRIEHEKQVVLDSQLRRIARGASELDDKQQRTAYAHRELRRLTRAGELPTGMDLCVRSVWS